MDDHHSATASQDQLRPESHDNQRHRHRHRHRHHSSFASNCLTCFGITIVFFVLAFAILIRCISMAYPKNPRVDLQEVCVQYINVVNATPTRASLSLALRMLFTAENDNRADIEYGVSTFNISYRGIPLGQGTIPGFYQPGNGVRRVETTVTVDGVNLLRGDAAELVRDASVDDRVELRVMGDVIGTAKIRGSTTANLQVG
ncbi:hypothetical protein OSB04_006587 [Centaurea solstitialis]|uniref:Late embryogenesis abundant protein LEA-2 subgroup domain-containing protein n=1 Tax=Centaurea solstitialis TaxID=347529 RepID=A0AA38WHL8_9ASTR|nr:hypothetical protein OSB04_006587 [Centaurea solstitialis]